jgi:nucleoid-associated protein YgaU
MPLKQLQITVEDTGTVLTVDYTPEEYTLNNENTFAVQNVPGLGSPIVQFVNGAQRTLDVELFFDSYDTPDLPKQDVREQTGPVLALMEINGEQHAPPILRVSMASLDVRCVLSRVTEKFVMFMPDGVPVRARLTCTFIEVVDPELGAKAANLQTAHFSKVHVVARGDTLSAIAAARYEDPTRWRPIALANELANPRDLETGQSLRIPALPYLDPRTGEAVA